MQCVRFQIVIFIIFSAILSYVIVNGQNYKIDFPIDTTKYEFSECKTSDGLDGACRRVYDCPSSNMKLTKSNFCSFVKEFPLYCCALNQKKVQLLSIQKSDNLKEPRPIEKICETYYPTVRRDNILITGGVRSLAQEHAHMAAIGWTNSDGQVDWNCGGSVITNQFIITAAHCTMLRGVKPDIARTGDLNLLVTENNTYPKDFKITEIHTHPDYKASAMYHDIALLKISPDFTPDVFLKPACLWTSDDVPVQELLGIGYGTTEFSGPRANELFQASITLLSQKQCMESIPPNPDVKNGIITGQFCAQDPNHVKDTCQGDSGGPLQFYNQTGDSNRPVIVGITSFGQYCAGQLPGVYTRVSTYLDWIEPIISKDFRFADEWVLLTPNNDDEFSDLPNN